ncbi:MAG: methyl-accepting chemotaxis protein [Pseudomonadota bacterium]
MILILITVNLQSAYHVRSAAAVAVDTVQSTRVLGSLVHELQKERGLSAGHIASAGQAFRSELADQRPLTDTELKQAEASINDLIAVDRRAADLRERLRNLSDLRGRIDSQQTTVPELAKFYTSSINDLIALLQGRVGAIEKAEIRALTVPLIAVVDAKEAAGLERAMGAAGFGSGVFKENTYTRFVGFAGAQAAKLQTAQAAASSEAKGAFDALYQRDAWRDVQALREIARDGLKTSEFQGVTGPQWFATSTAWVNALKELEDTVRADLEQKSEALLGTADGKILLNLIAGVLVVLVSLAVPFFIARAFQDGVQSILAAMRKIANAEFDFEIPHLDHNGEIGEFARMAQTFKGNAQDKIAAETASCAERERRETAEAEAREQEALAEAEHRRMKAEQREKEKAEEVRRAEAEERERARLAEAERKANEAKLREEQERSEAAARQYEEDQKRTQALAEVVRALSLRLNKLSSGDLAASVDTPFAEEYEQLRLDLNTASENLCTVIDSAIGRVQSLELSATQISDSSVDLARRTEQQAAELERSVSTLNQLVTGVRSATEGAQSAEDATKNVKDAAEASGAVMTEAMTSMKEIEDSSDQISAIIGVIDDIAFQTNLLALNAGVEAARAGEAGRGFAVVASEVRALAQRCSDAAGEIKALILKSNDQVKNGVGQVSKAGNSLSEIIDAISGATVLMSELSTASRQQLNGLAEISESVANLDRVTQQNAAMSQESTAGAVMLANEMKELGELMGQFNVEKDARSQAA